MNVRTITTSLLANTADPLFSDFWRIYTEAFPISERRTLEQHKLIENHPAYSVFVWHTGHHVLGFLTSWEYPDCHYVEHFAISPHHRSDGYGSKFLHQWMHTAHKPILLEIEKPVCPLTQRRLAFYLRSGFMQTYIDHPQPDYQNLARSIPMEILSFPLAISLDIYKDFSQKQQQDTLGYLLPFTFSDKHPQPN